MITSGFPNKTLLYSVTSRRTIFIKKIAPVIVGPLAFIFDISFMRAEVPDSASSFVTRILKKGSHSDPSNYRPS